MQKYNKKNNTVKHNRLYGRENHVPRSSVTRETYLVTKTVINSEIGGTRRGNKCFATGNIYSTVNYSLRPNQKKKER